LRQQRDKHAALVGPWTVQGRLFSYGFTGRVVEKHMKQMKALLFGVTVVAALAGSTLDARADGYRAERGYRYRTTYHDWDRGVSRHYGYYETDCRVTYNRGVRYQTCYEMEPTQYVYIEERHYSNGYQQINVYEYENASTPYVTYYVYDDGYTRRVERRDFHHHRHYHDSYYSPYWHHHETVWISLDWDNAFDKLIIGSYTMLIGADILAGAHSDGEAVVGLVALGLGSLSMSLASEQMKQESDLAKTIAAQKKDTAAATDVQ